MFLIKPYRIPKTCTRVSSKIRSCPKWRQYLPSNYILSKITNVFPMKLYRVKTYKTVSSEDISCQQLQKRFLWNYIVSITTEVFLLKLNRVHNYKFVSCKAISWRKLQQCFFWNYIVSQNNKSGSSGIKSCSTLQHCFHWNFIVSKTTQLFPLKLYRVQNYRIISSQIIFCAKLQNVSSNTISCPELLKCSF